MNSEQIDELIHDLRRTERESDQSAAGCFVAVLAGQSHRAMIELIRLIRQRDLLWSALAEIRSLVVMDLDGHLEDDDSIHSRVYKTAKRAIELAKPPLIQDPPAPHS